ncbi:hypothetical protein GCM10010520_53840 [Rhizobium viscosum]|uniref:Uncharacterized protein n=1 Tax=Rhizobium viscosum TaxID=1673 RepID=A0ABR9J023_RHIVS|nr:hypothetical protein [Rhizobium viscosum]
MLLRDLDPVTARRVLHIYDGIAQASWFNRNRATEWELLKLVLRHVVQDQDEEYIQKLCTREAFERFCRSA